MEKCKYCNGKNLILVSRIENQNVMDAAQVALVCADCSKWLKWCPKNERAQYLKRVVKKQKRIETLTGRIAHLITNPIFTKSPFKEIWDFYFSELGCGFMAEKQVIEWLNEYVEVESE